MQFFDNVSVFSMAQLKKTGAAGGTDFFEMNLPHCLLANVVKTEMEAVGSHIQVKNFCSMQCAPFLQVTIYIKIKNMPYCSIRFYTIPFYWDEKLGFNFGWIRSKVGSFHRTLLKKTLRRVFRKIHPPPHGVRAL